MIRKRNALFFLIVMITAQACSNTQKAGEYISTVLPSVCIDSSASCPHLTKDNNGRPVISWIRTINDSLAAVYYAVSPDNGKTFGNAVRIPGSDNVHPHGENMPKVIFKPDGTIIAAWGAGNPNPKNPYAGLVYYSQSFDNGKTWNGLNLLTKDTASIDQRYFDLAQLPDGEVAVIWLDNRTTSTKEGSSLFFAKTNGRSGFEHEQLISQACCQCCRTDLFIDSSRNIHVAYRAIINDSIRDMAHVVSTDKGISFSAPARISADDWVIRGCPHTGPSLTENKNGLHFAWHTEGKGSGVFYCSSPDNGRNFSPKDTVSSEPSAKHPQVITLSGGALLIVWDESVKKGKEYNAWLGAQLRKADGTKIATAHITSVNNVASFPALLSIDGHTAIIAYTMKIKDRTGVFYQLSNISF